MPEPSRPGPSYPNNAARGMLVYSAHLDPLRSLDKMSVAYPHRWPCKQSPAHTPWTTQVYDHSNSRRPAAWSKHTHEAAGYITVIKVGVGGGQGVYSLGTASGESCPGASSTLRRGRVWPQGIHTLMPRAMTGNTRLATARVTQ
jgi:hypothetical protein